MCESNVYRLKDGNKVLIMEAAALVEVEGNQIYLTGLFGEQKSVKGSIFKIDIEGHEIIIS